MRPRPPIRTCQKSPRPRGTDGDLLQKTSIDVEKPWFSEENGQWSTIFVFFNASMLLVYKAVSNSISSGFPRMPFEQKHERRGPTWCQLPCIGAAPDARQQQVWSTHAGGETGSTEPSLGSSELSCWGWGQRVINLKKHWKKHHDVRPGFHHGSGERSQLPVRFLGCPWLPCGPIYWCSMCYLTSFPAT